jgi:acetolactate synthase-1/2/3 large subunit
MNGGSLVAKILQSQGVQFVFTLCGGHISPILVGCKQHDIRVIDVRHEVNAVFAADAVARLTGVPGVAAVTAGPGVTNTITAVKNAQMAQVPLVLLGGATATILRGRGSLQDIDQMALMKPHVKWAARPDRVSEVAPALEKAFEIAQEGVPGPVFVEIAVDLLYDEETVREWTAAKTDRAPRNMGERLQQWYIKYHLNKTFSGKPTSYNRIPPKVVSSQPDPSQLREAAELLSKAERPVLVVGSQTMLQTERMGELVQAVESLNMPIFLSGMGRGLLGADHPLQMRHKRRNALKEADVVVLCGTPADFRLDYGGHIGGKATLIGVNRSKHDLNKNRRPDLGLECDALNFLVDVSKQVKAPPVGSGLEKAREEWYKTVRARHEARDTEIRQMAQEEVNGCNPLLVCEGMERALSDNSILVADGGDFVATASYIVQPRGPLTWLDPGVFGTLGVGAGFALGAKLVHPEADVWLVYGDGSAGYSIMEYDTFIRHNVPVISVIGNDAGWTQIARDQVVILKDDVATTLLHTDYDKVAEGWGAKGIHLDQTENIDSAMEEALELSRAGHPVVVNAIIGKTDFRKGSISM